MPGFPYDCSTKAQKVTTGLAVAIFYRLTSLSVIASPPGARGDGSVPVASTMPGDWLSHLASWGVRPKCSHMLDTMHMYVDHPYPPRDPENEGNLLLMAIVGCPGAISYFTHSGRKEFPRKGSGQSPFRILVAGGGTGDSALTYAASFHYAGIACEVVLFDMSRASIEVARKRAKIRNLESEIHFVQGNISEIEKSDLSSWSGGSPLFDWIDSTGVLHHLRHPAEGLRKLANLLKPDGGALLMLYATLGRTGVYDFQNMYRLLGVERDASLARQLVSATPETSWIKRNSWITQGEDFQMGDTGINDLLLHHCDSSFTIPETVDFVASAGMVITAFTDMDGLRLPKEMKKILNMQGAHNWHWLRKAAFAESVLGTRRMHTFYAVKRGDTDGLDGRARTSLGTKVTQDSILCHAHAFIRESVVFPAQIVRSIRQHRQEGRKDILLLTWKDLSGGAYSRMPMALAELLPHADCVSSIREAHTRISAEVQADATLKSGATPSLQELVAAVQVLSDKLGHIPFASVLFVLHKPASFSPMPNGTVSYPTYNKVQIDKGWTVRRAEQIVIAYDPDEDDWANNEKSNFSKPIVYTMGIVRKLQMHEVKTHLAVFAPNEDLQKPDVKMAMEKAARNLQGEILIILIDSAAQSHAPVLQHFLVSTTPAYRIASVRNEDIIPFFPPSALRDVRKQGPESSDPRSALTFQAVLELSRAHQHGETYSKDDFQKRFRELSKRKVANEL